MVKDLKKEKALACHLQYSIKKKSKVISRAVCSDKKQAIPLSGTSAAAGKLLSVHPADGHTLPLLAFCACIYYYTVYLSLSLSAAFSLPFSLCHSLHLLLSLNFSHCPYRQSVWHHLLAWSHLISITFWVICLVYISINI